MKPRIAVAIAAAVSIAGIVGIVTISGAAQSWTATITDPDGDNHTYRVQGDTEAEAKDAAFGLFRSDSTIVATPDGPPIPGGYPSIPAAEVDRDGDFDAGCSLFNGEGSWDNSAIGTDYPGSGAINRAVVGEGICSARLTVPSGNHRAEVAFNSIPNPDVVWEGLYYVPSSSGELGYMNQTKQSGAPCSNGGLDNRSGSSMVVATRATCSVTPRRDPIGNFPRDDWFAVKIAFRMGNAGSVAAWVDPDGAGPAPYEQRLAPVTRDTQTGDDERVRFRQGTYNSGPGTEPPAEVYIDGFHLDCIGVGGC